MATVLIRNMSERTKQVLEARAEKNGRSLEAELRGLLDAAAQPEETSSDENTLGVRLIGNMNSRAGAILTESGEYLPAFPEP